MTGADAETVSRRIERIGAATLYLGDCREILPTLGKVDAVVTDPPYGIGESARKVRSRGTSSERVRRLTVTDYGDFDWDKAPPPGWLIEQLRDIGTWQIIFGGNFFDLPPSSCWLVWDKLNTGDFADCELAWTNLQKAVRRFRYHWNGCMRQERDIAREHPTQKPIGVMKWAIEQLPDDARTILDPFMGSGTTGVAAIKLGRQFIGIEAEAKYFEIACRRIEEAPRQPDMFVQSWDEMWQQPFDFSREPTA